MIAVEFKRVLREGLPLFLILAALFVASQVSDQADFLTPALEIFLLLYASFSGWSLFEHERQEGAFEYMLSLPLSRSRLLLLKAMPRMLVSGLLLVTYLVLRERCHLPSFVAAGDLTLAYAAFFLLSLALSISLKNFITVFFLTSMATLGLVLLLHHLDGSRPYGEIVTRLFPPLLLVPLLFWLRFRTFDIRPVAHFNRRFLPWLAALICLIAGGNAVWRLLGRTSWANYFLTRQGAVLRYRCDRSQLLIEGKGKRQPGCLIALREDPAGKTLFALARRENPGRRCADRSVIALDLATGKRRALYQIPPGWTLCGDGYLGQIGQPRPQGVRLLLQNTALRQLMLLDVGLAGVRAEYRPGPEHSLEAEVVLFSRQRGGPIHLLKSVDGEVLLSRLQADGQAIELARGKSYAVWGERILLVGESGATLFEAGAALTSLWQSTGDVRQVMRRSSAQQTVNPEARLVILRIDGEYRLLHMETAALKTIELPTTPFNYLEGSDGRLILIYSQPEPFRIVFHREGQEVARTWRPGIRFLVTRVSPFGMLVFNQKEYRITSFTD